MPLLKLRSKPLLIGQAPSKLTQERCPLGQEPAPFSGLSGAKLAAIMRIDSRDLPKLFDLANLLDHFPGRRGDKGGDHFPEQEARASAEKMLPRLAGRVVLLVGKAVAGAFGVEDMDPLESRRGVLGAREIVMVPHPSGINAWYNNLDNCRRLRSLLWWAATRGRCKKETPGC